MLKENTIRCVSPAQPEILVHPACAKNLCVHVTALELGHLRERDFRLPDMPRGLAVRPKALGKWRRVKPAPIEHWPQDLLNRPHRLRSAGVQRLSEVLEHLILPRPTRAPDLVLHHLLDIIPKRERRRRGARRTAGADG